MYCDVENFLSEKFRIVPIHCMLIHSTLM